jgi:hypothetical protein
MPTQNQIKLAYEGIVPEKELDKIIKEVEIEERLKKIKINNGFTDEEMERFVKENKEIIKLVVDEKK